MKLYRVENEKIVEYDIHSLRGGRYQISRPWWGFTRSIYFEDMREEGYRYTKNGAIAFAAKQLRKELDEVRMEYLEIQRKAFALLDLGD